MTTLDDLKPLEEESLARKIPIVGREKGTWLQYQVVERQPKRVLELGTANGYSGCILGSEGAVLLTIEKDSVIAEEAKANFKKYQVNATVVVEDVVNVIDELLLDETNIESFDIIFIDCAKKVYDQVLDQCIKLVRVGGVIIADNITFEGCKEYKKRVMEHELLQTDLINIADGLSCSEKLS